MKKLLFLGLLLGVVSLSAQKNKQVEKGLLKANLLLPGISYELGVGNKTTVNLEAGFGFALRGGSDSNTEFGLFPVFVGEFRYYANMQRRLEKGKNISGNTGNYISFTNSFQPGNPIIGDLAAASDYYYSSGIVYGLQRTYRKGFYFGLAFGAGVFVDENRYRVNANPGLILEARLGWVISGRKKK